MVCGSAITRVRKRLTRVTSATSSSTERKRCTTPMPPSCASAMAIGAVVTVSMLAETTGISSAIRRVSCVRVDTSARERRRDRRAQGPHPLSRAATLVHELPYDEQIKILATHPAIGQRTGLSARSAAEQGSDADPEVLTELARLNAEYEARHGFRFVVFVNRR